MPEIGSATTATKEGELMTTEYAFRLSASPGAAAKKRYGLAG